MMNWKEQLHMLEEEGKWDEAIAFMQTFIAENPDNMDAWMFMNYLLVNLQTEEQYDKSKEDEYWALSKKYFKESYAKFSQNPEFLYLMGRTAVMGHWLFGISQKEYEAMITRAHQLEPDNLLYKEHYYSDLYEKDPNSRELKEYKKMLWTPNNPIEQQLKDKGALGEYLLRIERGWVGKTED